MFFFCAEGLFVSKPLAAAQPSEPISYTGPTVEQALYGLLLLAALLLRFLRLGSAAPLNPLEAGQAWVAWADASGHSGMIPALAHSPLLYTVQRFLFWLTDGGGDGWARAVPALAGGLLVLLPWLLRGTLGRPAALILALLLALDPWLLTFSRMGDGAILSAALGLLLLAGLPRSENLSPNGRRWLAGVAALFLISGPLAWLLLPVMAGAVVLFGSASLWPSEQNERARLLTIGGGTIVAGATGLLSHWEGLGVISTSLTVALDSMRFDAGYSLGWAFLRLAVDQPLLLVVGGAGLLAAWLPASAPSPTVGRRPEPVEGEGRGGGSSPSPEMGESNDGGSPPSPTVGEGWGGGARWRWLLTGWFVWGLLLLLLPGRNPTTLLVIGLPLLISTARTVGRLLAYATERVNWQDGSLIAAALAVLLVTTAFWTNQYSNEWSNEDFDRLTLLFYGIVPLLGIFFVWWAGWRTSSQVFVLLGLPLLLLASLSSGWALNLPGETTKGNSLFAQAPQPGLMTLADDVARLSSLRALDPDEALVLVDVEPELQPLLGWVLRSMRQLRFVDGINPAFLTDRAALVVADEAAGASLPGGYVGSHYPVLQRWLPTDLTGAGPVARWILLRELKTTPPTTSVVLWAREE